MPKRAEDLPHINCIHGLRNHRVYAIWRTVKLRCDKPSNNSYKNYGGRGITYAEHWRDFIPFIEDMGLPPTERHTLDRIDPNGNYERSNCRWLDYTLQAKTRRNIRFHDWLGKRLCLADVSRAEGVNANALNYYVNRRGWTLADAVSHIKRRHKLGLTAKNRGMRLKTHCIRGHPIPRVEGQKYKGCLICKRDRF